MVRIIERNRSTLKSLTEVPQALFDQLPIGLVLDVFAVWDVDAPDIKVGLRKKVEHDHRHVLCRGFA